MKKCIKCETVFSSPEFCCPGCDWRPDIQEGINTFAPNLAQEGEGFKPEFFSRLIRLEAANFWFQARNRLIVWAMKKYAADFDSYLEVGCGTGYVLSGIAHAFPNAKLFGSEIFTNGLTLAATRVPQATLMQMDARSIPFSSEFDVIGAFDVLEHIEEDDAVLHQIRDALKPQGLVMLSVPQHRWLWSATDEYACHVRRYSTTELQKKVEAVGFKVLRTTSFLFFLLPIFYPRHTQESQG